MKTWLSARKKTVALVAIVIVGLVGSWLAIQPAGATDNPVINANLNKSGELVITGTGFTLAKDAVETEVVTYIVLADNTVGISDSTMLKSDGSFSQTYTIPKDYLGAIGVASTTNTQTVQTSVTVIR